MEGTAVYEPINGKEARMVLKHDASEKIDKIYLFKEGHAFHRLHMAYTLICTAYPADNPVPTLEFEIARSAKGFDEQKDYIQQTEKIKVLEEKKAELLAGIDRIDKILSVIRPIVEIEGDLQAGDTPDHLRIAHGLPVPRIVTSTDVDGFTTKSEKYIHATETS